MATVYILSTKPWPGPGRGPYKALLEYARQDRFGIHQRTTDPDDADLILFVEYDASQPFLQRVRQHPLVKRHRERCFVVSERDHTFPFLPGLYTSVPRRWYRPDRMRSGPYLDMFIDEEHVVHHPLDTDSPDYLFSFTGSFNTAPVRERLQKLSGHEQGVVRDTAKRAEAIDAIVDQAAREEARSRFRKEYADLMADSLFVLCPRGRAPTSVRLQDTMKIGRVPVILSDEWVPPEGPDWNTFSLRVAEQNVEQIPDLLEEHEHEASIMGARARTAWEDWFAPDVLFHRVAEWCLDIQAERSLPESLLRLTAWWQLLHQPYRYNYYCDWKERRFH
jgi:hypothetical protein